MLTIEDKPTIKNAIMRRLDNEPGVAVVSIDFRDNEDGSLRVHVWLLRTDTIQEFGMVDTHSDFDLPKEFHHSHLINEIDQIAEHSKEAKRQAGGRLIYRPEFLRGREPVTGTGLRGLWPQ